MIGENGNKYIDMIKTRSGHLGQNGHNQNENPHGLQSHYQKETSFTE